MSPSAHTLPHARDRVADWTDAWRRAGQLVLLLDFDGTLAPIVAKPELATMPASTRGALDRLLRRDDLHAAVVSGRGLADVRARAQLPGIAYAGNHGMEIEGPGVRQVHEAAAAARPQLELARDEIEAALHDVSGALVEDKGLTLSIHYRMVDRSQVDRVRDRVRMAAGAAKGLHVTEGKEVLEVRPRVDWHKGRAVEFLLSHISPRDGAPVLYIGDDVTDEDAFRALSQWSGGTGEGVLVAEEPPAETAAASYVLDPGEVAELLSALHDAAP